MVDCESMLAKMCKLIICPAISTTEGTENGYRLTSWDRRCELKFHLAQLFSYWQQWKRCCRHGTNVNNGFDIYKIDSGNFVRTLVTRDPIKTYPKGVAFANHGQAIVGGSDHGRAYIFERKSGRMITTLSHGNDEGVQMIGVSA